MKRVFAISICAPDDTAARLILLQTNDTTIWYGWVIAAWNIQLSLVQIRVEIHIVVFFFFLLLLVQQKILLGDSLRML